MSDLVRQNLLANVGAWLKLAQDPGQSMQTLLGFGHSILVAAGNSADEVLPEAQNLGDLMLDRYEGVPLMGDDQAMHMVRVGLEAIDHALVAGPGSLGVIAGKTSTGKTTFATQALIRTMQHGRRAMMFSLEMTREEIGARFIANYCGIDSYDVMCGRAADLASKDAGTPEFKEAIRVASEAMVVSDGVCTSFDGICKVIRREVANSGVQVVFVDYFTLVNPPDTHTRNANIAYILGQMSKGFKALAKELAIVIVLISQFNREVDDGEEPFLRHLRETGQLEQDANWVILLWTGQKSYGPDQSRDVWVKIEKNRGGKRNVRCYADFDPATGRFSTRTTEATVKPRQASLDF